MPQPDDKIIALLEALATCLCTELGSDGEEPPNCLCGLIPGIFPAQSYAGVGEDMAWVRLGDYFGSNSPGAQLQLPYNQVFGHTILIEMGVIRCVEWPADSMFEQNQLHGMTIQQIRDLGAMERAIACCAGSSWDDNQFVVGNYRAIGPEGDTLGGVISIAMQFE